MEINVANLSIFLFGYLYRNLSIIEDAHAGDSIIMNMNFYNEVKKKVKNNLLRLAELNVTKEMYATISHMGQEYSYVPSELNLSDCFEFYTYIIDGEFLRACQDNIIFDDNSMNIINRDIINRVYTLLINGRLLPNIIKRENL